MRLISNGQATPEAAIGTLGRVYGPHFASGQPDTETLGQVLEEMDSLSQLVHGDEEGHLDHKLAAAKAH